MENCCQFADHFAVNLETKGKCYKLISNLTSNLGSGIGDRDRMLQGGLILGQSWAIVRF